MGSSAMGCGRRWALGADHGPVRPRQLLSARALRSRIAAETAARAKETDARRNRSRPCRESATDRGLSGEPTAWSWIEKRCARSGRALCRARDPRCDGFAPSVFRYGANRGQNQVEVDDRLIEKGDRKHVDHMTEQKHAQCPDQEPPLARKIFGVTQGTTDQAERDDERKDEQDHQRKTTPDGV